MAKLSSYIKRKKMYTRKRGKRSRRGRVSVYRGGNRLPTETKYVDMTQTLSTGATTATPFQVLLNGCAQGADVNQRIGRNIKMKYLTLKLELQPSSTWNDAYSKNMRVMLVYDKQPNAAAFQYTDVVTADPYPYLSPRNDQNKQRFVILYDKTHLIKSFPNFKSAVGPSDPANQPVTLIKINKKLSKLPPTCFTGTASTIASITTGALFLVVLQTYEAARLVQCSYSSKTLQSTKEYHLIRNTWDSTQTHSQNGNKNLT